MARLSQIYDVDLKLLRCFCAIVEGGGFNAAQAALNLSQSVLSEHLKSLEVRLGVRLCQRGPKGFKLFRDGEMVYQAAQELFAAMDVFRQCVSVLHDEAYGELSVGLQDGVLDNPQSRISEALELFSERHPEVRFKVEIMLGYQMIGRVADGAVHVGIGLPSDQFEQLSFEPLFNETHTLCCGRTHPLFDLPDWSITMEQIEAATACSRGRQGRPRHLNRGGDVGHGVQARLALILCGRNVGYVADHAARPHIEAGYLRELRPDAVVRTSPISAVTRPGTSDHRLARRFVDSLIASHRPLAEPQCLLRGN
jgi:LysR family transcriptional regulator, transcriptional activator for bauABCD operon